MAKFADLSGKVAIITGSSSGIGLATAERLVSLGAKVTLTGRNLEGLAEAKKKCLNVGAKDSDVLSIPGEITDENTRAKLVSETLKHFGKLDILINNAGALPLSSIAMGTANLQVFDKVFDINVRALVDLTMKAVPHLIKTKGNIINVSSVGGMKPVPNFMFYCMAKASVEMFTRSIAQELGAQGVRANTVSPGNVRTNIATSAGLTKEAAEKLYESDLSKAMQVLDRVGEPTDIANLIAFLVSGEASWITGCNYVIDGGNLVRVEGLGQAK